MCRVLTGLGVEKTSNSESTGVRLRKETWVDMYVYHKIVLYDLGKSRYLLYDTHMCIGLGKVKTISEIEQLPAHYLNVGPFCILQFQNAVLIKYQNNIST